MSERKKQGGLNLIDPIEVKDALQTKWVMHAFEPSDSNIFKKI